jgi:hypothetical protein
MNERARRPEVALEVRQRTRGRVVLAEAGGAVHLGRGYEIWRSDDDGASWARAAALPRPRWRRLAERSRLASRLIRQEVRALARLADGTYVAANREGVFFGRAGAGVLGRAEVESREWPLLPPMRIGLGPADVVVWGEYGSGHGRPVRLFASRDRGRSYELVHALEPDSVLHVHNVIWDPRLRHYWVLAGDHGDEPGIGRLSEDLARFEWWLKGEQRFRAVSFFDFGDHLVYATDTERETNGLMRLDKTTGRLERLRDFEGSCIYACRYGGIYALTTTVEPSPANPSRDATLWLSRDGERWRCAFRARKDRWHADLFQFGSVVLPSGATERETVFFSGQAVEGLDGCTLAATLRPDDPL